MPKRTDLHKILIIGAGPIVIGQACEFDYSGSQACKALREEGFEVVLVNSNPATIMTDPAMADRTYIEPVVPEFVEKILAVERPDALPPTLGGQAGLNVAPALYDSGALDRYEPGQEDHVASGPLTLWPGSVTPATSGLGSQTCRVNPTPLPHASRTVRAQESIGRPGRRPG